MTDRQLEARAIRRLDYEDYLCQRSMPRLREVGGRSPVNPAGA